jgi:hypothetical protein
MFAEQLPGRHRELPERARARAKAEVHGMDYRREVSRAFTRACGALTLNELSMLLPLEDGHCRDERQIARWQSGTERVQTDVVLRCEPLWVQFLEELARLRGDVIVTTQICIRRTA